MLKEKRFEYILQQLQSEEMLTYEALASNLDVSEDTVRRDIDYLHKNGLLSKVRGGAILRSKNPLTFQDRYSYLQSEKDVIALKAQQFIKDGITIFMDGGTTICAIANYFPNNVKIRVVTSNAMLIPILTAYPNIDLILLGGTYNQQTASTVGETTCHEVGQYIADLYLMGTCGIHDQYGVSAVVQQDAAVKRAMLASAKKVIALANQDRLRATEAFKICDLSAVDVLITNLDSTDEALDGFRNRGVELV